VTDEEKNAEIARRLGLEETTRYIHGTNAVYWRYPNGTLDLLPDYLHSCCACKEIKAWLLGGGYRWEMGISKYDEDHKPQAFCVIERGENYGWKQKAVEIAKTEECALCEAFLKLGVESD